MAAQYPNVQFKDDTFSLDLNGTGYSLSGEHCQLNKIGTIIGTFAVHKGTGRVFRGKAHYLSTDSGCQELEKQLQAKLLPIPLDALVWFGEAIYTDLNARPQTIPTPPNVPGGSLQQTDLGNAERLVTRHGSDLRYCHVWGKWLVWDGQRWQMDEGGEVYRRAKGTVRAIYQEASATTDDGLRRSLALHAVRSEQKPRIEAMVDLASFEQGISVKTDMLDCDPWLLTVANGTIDLQTGTLHPPAREDYITRLAPVGFDPEAKCPTFLAFLERIFASDKELIAFVKRAVGYSLTGNTSERCIFILYGGGRNGKSTLLQIILALLGDYSLRTPTTTLLAKRNDSIPNDVARLQGARFVAASETDEGRQMAEALVKDLTGQDRISARYMRAEWFDFVPVCKIWLATNHRPKIQGTDHAIWDRIRLIPFNVRIPDLTDKSVPADQRADPDLLDKLKAELPGILAWAVEGCLEWQQQRLGWPKVIRDATSEYERSMDLVSAFLDECCVIIAGAKIGVGDLYGRYRQWILASGERALEKRGFGTRLAEKGFTQEKATGGKRVWLGIGLPAGAEDLLGSLSGISGASGKENGMTAHEEKAPVNPVSLPLTPLTPLTPESQRQPDVPNPDLLKEFLRLGEQYAWPTLTVGNLEVPAGKAAYLTFTTTMTADQLVRLMPLFWEWDPKVREILPRPTHGCPKCSGTQWHWSSAGEWECVDCQPGAAGQDGTR